MCSTEWRNCRSKTNRWMKAKIIGSKGEED